MPSWAAEELRYADLGDKRLNRRLIDIVETLSAKPTVSVPQACGTWAKTKAVYRFWDNQRVTPEAILDGHIRSTIERVLKHDCVLLIQDTTNLDFAHHPSTKGLGHLDNLAQYGMKLHTTLAVSTAGVPLGLVDHQMWARAPETFGRSNQRQRRPTAEKESQRWLTSLERAQQRVPETVAVVTIADSEADIFDLFALPRREGSHILIRATHNRRVETAGHLWDAMRQRPVAGQYMLELRRKEDVPARQARMSVRYASLTIQPPKPRLKEPGLQPLQLQVILAEEDSPPAGHQAVRWLLVTSLPVSSLEDALRCLHWYSYRWLIERFHFVLKSGCRFEDLQLENAERLKRALASYLIVAWRLLWLTYEARRRPEQLCSEVLETHEWQALYCFHHRTPHPPPRPPTLHQAVHWIARLGGFLGRRADGEPGVKTIWLGFRRLADIAAAWQLMHGMLGNPPSTYG
jgi:hypothetical protein